MKEKETKNITNEYLAELLNDLRGEVKIIKGYESSRRISSRMIEASIEKLEEKIGGLRIETSDMRKVVDQLEEGAFSKNEKEDILGVIEYINQRLKDEVLGKQNITLERSEYDILSNTAGFENRFEKIEK